MNASTKNRILPAISLIALLIIFTDFFDFRPLIGVFKYLKVLLFLPLLCYCWKPLFQEKNLFANPVKLLFFAVLFSMIPAYICWHQSFIYSLSATIPYFGFLLYFYALKSNVSPSQIERILILFSGLYVILYFWQFFNYRTVFFGSWESSAETRGIIRIIFSGEGFLFFGIAYSFGQILNKHKRGFYLIWLGVLLVVMFMQVTRQYVMAVGIVIILGLFRKTKLYIKILAIFLMVIAFNIYQYSDNPMIEGLRSAQENDMELKEDYIRILAIKYFLSEMAPDNFAVIFGNGTPFPKSAYGQHYYTIVQDDQSIYYDDVGLFGGYALFGICFVIGYILIAYKTIRCKLPFDKMYLKYYLVMIFTMSFSSRSVLGWGFVPVTMLVLYLFSEYAKKDKLLRKNDK